VSCWLKTDAVLCAGHTKALLRRARALAWRHEYEAVERDLVTLRTLCPLDPDVEELERLVARLRREGERKEERVFADMFDRGKAKVDV
jgi:hypothetical protein